VSGLQAIAIAGWISVRAAGLQADWISVRAAGCSYSRLYKCPGCRL